MTILYGRLLKQTDHEFLIEQEDNYAYIPNGNRLDKYHFEVCSSKYGNEAYITNKSLEILEAYYFDKTYELYEMELW